MWQKTAVKQAFILFLVLRLLLSGWAVLVLRLIPLPPEPNEQLRPYLGQPILDSGLSGALLGPWQRFDSQHYLRIAQQGYTDERDSVFPPLYPGLIASLGWLLGNSATTYLIAALLISNLATVALFALFYHVITSLHDQATANRTLLYFALFPASFFLFAAYTESLFILLTLGCLWAAQNSRFSLAGFLGFLAALTRLTGGLLIIPLLYEYYRQYQTELAQSWTTFLQNRKQWFTLLTLALPAWGTLLFLLWRWWAGLPPLNIIYARYWYQTTSFPGVDMITAVQTIFFGGPARAGKFTIYFDFACALFLIISTLFIFRRYGITYGLYTAVFLLFILLPTSPEKPLFSFSRYTLTFFPAFILLGQAGHNPWLNRLILYPFLALYLYLSGQFFIWGWVA